MPQWERKSTFVLLSWLVKIQCGAEDRLTLFNGYQCFRLKNERKYWHDDAKDKAILIKVSKVALTKGWNSTDREHCNAYRRYDEHLRGPQRCKIRHVELNFMSGAPSGKVRYGSNTEDINDCYDNQQTRNVSCLSVHKRWVNHRNLQTDERMIWKNAQYISVQRESTSEVRVTYKRMCSCSCMGGDLFLLRIDCYYL